MTESTTVAVSNVARFEHTMTIGSEFSGRITKATMGYLILTPPRIIRIVAIALVTATAASLVSHLDVVATVIVIVAVFFGILALYVLMLVIVYVRSRRQTSQRLPVGSEYSMRMNDSSMRLAYSLVTTEISYTLYKSVRSTKDLVILTPRIGRRPTLLPRDLFTPESLAWLTKAVQGA